MLVNEYGPTVTAGEMASSADRQVSDRGRVRVPHVQKSWSGAIPRRATSYLLPLLFLCSTAIAQRAEIVELPNGKYIGMAYLADGTSVFLFDVQVRKIPSPVVTPPAPIASGPLTSVVFRVPEKLSVTAAEALINIRDWVDSQDSKELHHYVFSPDSQDVDGTINQTVKALHDKMPTGAFYPYAFLTQKSNGKDVIVWQGELKDSAEYIERMKARLK